MITRLIITAAAVGAVALHSVELGGAARCSYFAKYPSATGRHAFMLATATAGEVTASIDTSFRWGSTTVPAQLMKVDDVAGYRSDELRKGLRRSGSIAVFVRYSVNMSCGPWPAEDGAFDSVGVGGLYVGSPRPMERWIDGRPTFDVFHSAHYPLPQGLRRPSGHGMITRVDSTPVMAAGELMRMYRALWAESISVGDTTVERRIRHWVERNPRSARKQPAQEVAMGMVSEVTEARLNANPIPFRGTYAIMVTVPGVDSLLMYARSSSRTRVWRSEISRDSITGIPVAEVPESFAIDLTTAAFIDSTSRWWRNNPCSPALIVIDELPIEAEPDSTWRVPMSGLDFLECAPAVPGFARLIHRDTVRSFNPGVAWVTFRQHTDGRVTFEGRATREGSPGIVLRGERLSMATIGPPWD